MKIGLLCVVCLFTALSLGSAMAESLTYDEVFYLEEGRRILQTRTFSDPYNPPIAILLSGLPGMVGLTAPIAARGVTVILGIFLVLAVYRVGGLAAAILVAFEPTILPNSHYVTTDIASPLFIFLAVIAWMRTVHSGGTGDMLLTGLASGYAIASKMTAIPYLAVSFAVIWLLRHTGTGTSWLVRRWRRIAASAAVAVLVVWTSYIFTPDVVIRERSDAGRVSVRLIAYGRDRNIPFLEPLITYFQTQPIPLGTYIGTVKNNLLRLGKPARIFFDGTMYDRTQWHFMLFTVLRKIPIPLFALLAAGIVLARKRQIRLMAAIGAGIIAAASLIGTAPLVRLVLPAIPFLAVAAGEGIRVIERRKGIWAKEILSFLLLWYIAGTVFYYPHFISYANLLAGPRNTRYETLSDSNLDWGQALPDLVRYARLGGIGTLKFSYFGRDDGAKYGLPSNTPYGSWKYEDICAFHDVTVDPSALKEATVISVSNWHACGYYLETAYRKENIRDVAADVFLVF